ncbi:MAG: GtrA family protein [Clostridia bacterium]|nr:GtrA family protein [Clostridia bacterium]
MKKERQEIEKLKLNQIDIKNINWKTIKGLYFGYKEVINYLVFGVLAMIVNFVSYYIFAKMLNLDEVIGSGLSWFCSVLFAYITNKLFVFESKTQTLQVFFIEMISFFLARIVSGALCDVGTFALMVKVFHINDIFSKVVTQVMVVVVNYLFSKLIIFRKKKETK